MNRRGTLLCSTLMVSGLLMSGCGTIHQDSVANTPGKEAHYKTRSGRQVRLEVGRVMVDTRQEQALKDAVARYLVDQAKAAIGQHDIFQVADAGTSSQSLLEQFMQAGSGAPAAAAVDGTLELRVLELHESKGATVRVGLISKQSKTATAVVEASIRLRNGRTFKAKAKGASSKGAVGVVAMVNRKAMDGKDGVWALDGSMAGGACTEAIQSCVGELARRMHSQIRRLKPDAAERLLQPGGGR